MGAAKAIDWVFVKSKSTLVKLAVSDIRGGVQFHDIKSLPVVVGRSDFAEVKVHDPFASRMQCVIAYTGDELIVRDLESTHGTSVNGQLSAMCRLRKDDEIVFGKLTKMTVEQVADKSEFAAAKCG